MRWNGWHQNPPQREQGQPPHMFQSKYPVELLRYAAPGPLHRRVRGDACWSELLVTNFAASATTSPVAANIMTSLIPQKDRSVDYVLDLRPPSPNGSRGCRIAGYSEDRIRSKYEPAQIKQTDCSVQLELVIGITAQGVAGRRQG